MKLIHCGWYGVVAGLLLQAMSGVVAVVAGRAALLRDAPELGVVAMLAVALLLLSARPYAFVVGDRLVRSPTFGRPVLALPLDRRTLEVHSGDDDFVVSVTIDGTSHSVITGAASPFDSQELALQRVERGKARLRAATYAESG